MEAPIPKFSVVIPIYKCSDCLAELHRRIVESLTAITSDFELLLVDDGSPDNAWETISSLAKTDPRIRGFQLSRNFGQHHAITCGLDNVRGQWVIVMDGDLQDQPEEIPKLFHKANEGYDIVFARREERRDSLLKRASSYFFYAALSYLTGVNQDKSIANFGIYHNTVIRSLCELREASRYFPVMVRWVGYKSTSIEVCHAARFSGKTSYNLIKLLNLATDVIIAFSDKPLRLAVNIGLTISVCSLFMAIYVVGRILFFGTVVAGWGSMIVSLWLSTGLIISLLGITGLYIGKSFDQVKKRPLYLIRQRISQNA